MALVNPILKADNTFQTVTNYAGNTGGVQNLPGLPLATVGDIATGAIGVRVVGTVYPSNGEFNIPEFDYQAFTYFGSTNNVQTRVFKTGGSGGTTVATLTYTYVGGGAADNDDVATITQT